LRNLLIREPTKTSMGLPPPLVLIQSHPRVETIFVDDPLLQDLRPLLGTRLGSATSTKSMLIESSRIVSRRLVRS
jgi:hypothetical protein